MTRSIKAYLLESCPLKLMDSLTLKKAYCKSSKQSIPIMTSVLAHTYNIKPFPCLLCQLYGEKQGNS